MQIYLIEWRGDICLVALHFRFRLTNIGLSTAFNTCKFIYKPNKRTRFNVVKHTYCCRVPHFWSLEKYTSSFITSLRNLHDCHSKLKYCRKLHWFWFVEQTRNIFFFCKLGSKYSKNNMRLPSSNSNKNYTNLAFWGPWIVIYWYSRSQKDALFLNFILIYNSRCFGQTCCPSSGVLILYSQQLVFVKLFMLTVC